MTMLRNMEDVGAGMQFLLLPEPAEPITVWVNGKRYGGFRSREHARWVIRSMGIRRFEMVEGNGERRWFDSGFSG